MKKIRIGTIALSKEGWEWWIENFQKQQCSFTKWIKVNEVICKIKDAVNDVQTA